MRVALIGLGRMGTPMAHRLAEADLSLVLANRTLAKAEAVAAETGADVATTPAEAASGADVVITMLADEHAGAEVYDGTDGVIAGLRQGAVAVDMTTVSPAWPRALATRIAAAAGRFLDVPVSGSVPAATAGTLTLMAGGDAAALDVARPVLERLGSPIIHMGPVGTGAAVKLVINNIVFSLNQALSESIVLAERAGIDPARAYDVLEQSAVAAPLVGYKRDAYLHPEEAPTVFTGELAGKDVGLVLALAAEVGARMPQAETNLAALQEATARFPERDFSYVAEYLRVIATSGGPSETGR